MVAALPSPAAPLVSLLAMLALLGSVVVSPAWADDVDWMGCMCMQGQPVLSGKSDGPVCGSDGKTYPALCDLQCASTQPGAQTLAVKHDGACEPSEARDYPDCVSACERVGKACGSGCTDGDLHCAKTCVRSFTHCACGCTPLLPVGADIDHFTLTAHGDEEVTRCLGDAATDLDRCRGRCSEGDKACDQRCIRANIHLQCTCGASAARLAGGVALLVVLAARWLLLPAL